MTTTDPILQTVNLSRTVPYNGQSKTIVDNVSHSFQGGQIYSIIGPSGAGKSSLLRLLNRLDEPTRGDVLFYGKSNLEYSPCKLRKSIGYLFQQPYLFPGSVRDNLLYVNDQLDDTRISLLCEQAHIPDDMVEGNTDNFSEGEKQRVAFARMLAVEPEIMLLDEPTSALDPSYTDAIENLIREIVAGNSTTVIMISHHPQQALRMGGEAILMVKGKLIESGVAEQMINQPQTELGRRYRDKELR